jgi:hypothetical protein
MPDATERKALAVSAFIASLLLFPLGGKVSSVLMLFRERVSALMALGLACALLVYHLAVTRREQASAPAAPAAAPAPPAADPPADPPVDLPVDPPSPKP